ncbi:AAA family ATPase [Amniculibacterium sp. G2-70]|uniref:AAA family ATPase n=1 Tax=Amniculibacterium sp. G2-70 TaxID=2767188 RepID=UPI001654BA00|nr:ATP-binding protein [Amniculibacterium sp. G2-70]
MKKQSMNNPFLITGYVSPDYFCNRVEEVESMTDALKNGRDITLISPRRYGKTGLIKHFFYLINKNEPEIKCIYIDIFSTRNLNDFVSVFAESVIRELSTTLEKAIRNFGVLFKSLRPVVTYDDLSGQPELTVAMDKNTNAEVSLSEIFNYLKKTQVTCYFAIDEFQQINNYPEKGTEALLRSYIQFLPHVRFIFSGSIQHTMQEIFLSPKRPFYQSTQMSSLEVIPKKEYFIFTKTHFEKKSLTIDSQCFDIIYDEFDGHTWYIQAILNRLFSFNKDINNPEQVFVAINQLIEENSYYYQELLKAYSVVQRNVIEAIALEKQVNQVNSGDFITKYKLKNASSVNRVLTKLIANEVVYLGNKGYIIYDRLMGLWLRKLKKKLN